MKGVKLISGQNALGRAAGVTQKTISEWLKDSGWKWGRGPWKSTELAAILAFGKARRRRSNDPAVAGEAIRAGGGAAGGGGAGAGAGAGGTMAMQVAGMTPLEKVKVKVGLVTAATKDFDLEVKKKAYILRDDVEKERVARIHAVKNAAIALVESGIVELIQGADGLEGKEILRGRVIEMLQAFAGGKY